MLGSGSFICVKKNVEKASSAVVNTVYDSLYTWSGVAVPAVPTSVHLTVCRAMCPWTYTCCLGILITFSNRCNCVCGFIRTLHEEEVNL